jgi:hypothetical protein
MKQLGQIHGSAVGFKINEMTDKISVAEIFSLEWKAQ